MRIEHGGEGCRSATDGEDFFPRWSGGRLSGSCLEFAFKYRGPQSVEQSAVTLEIGGVWRGMFVLLRDARGLAREVVEADGLRLAEVI